FRIDVPKYDKFMSATGDPPPVVAAAKDYGIDWAAPKKSGEELTLRLVKDQPIAGRVIDIEGRPIANAEIRVQALYTSHTDRLDTFLTGWKAEWRIAWGQVEKRALPPAEAVIVTPTDRDGRFRITGAGAERLVILDVHAPAIA